jgi:hypothetical protein
MDICLSNCSIQQVHVTIPCQTSLRTARTEQGTSHVTLITLITVTTVRTSLVYRKTRSLLCSCVQLIVHNDCLVYNNTKPLLQYFITATCPLYRVRTRPLSHLTLPSRDGSHLGSQDPNSEVHPHNSRELSRIPFALDLGHACIFYRSSKLNDAPPMHAAEYLQHGAPRSGNANLVLEHIDSRKRESRRVVAPTIASTDNNGQLALLRDTAGPQAISVKATRWAVGRGWIFRTAKLV